MVYANASAEADLDAVFAALSHPARRHLVRYLAQQDEPPRMTAAAAAQGMSPQLLNKHTAALEKARLVSRRTIGRERHLVLDTVRLAAAQAWMAETRRFWEHQLDALDAYITELGLTGTEPAPSPTHPESTPER